MKTIFISLIAVLLLCSQIVLSQIIPVIEWDFRNGLQGWTTYHDLREPTVTDEGLRFQSIGEDPWLEESIDLPGNSITRFVVRMKSTGDKIGELLYYGENGGTKITLNFEPRQSFFIVFGSTEEAEGIYHNNEIAFSDKLTGPWQVSFDPEWGGPASVQFDNLTDWKVHTDNGIKYYSGTAMYTKSFDLPANLKGSKKPIYIDLGKVVDMAEVTLNGVNLGVDWSEPYQVDISSALKDTNNKLEVAVVNRWSNRLLGDKVLNQNYTTGNGTHADLLFSSGLLGPVKLGQ